MSKGVFKSSSGRPLIAIDLGSSATKVFFQLAEREQLLIMESDIFPISLDQVTPGDYVPCTSPEVMSWVGVEDRYYAIGKFAQNFARESGLVEQKRGTVIPKVLAVLGVIATVADATVIQRATLSLLLPISELRDLESLGIELTRAAAAFSFRGQIINFEITQVEIIPEGSGIFLLHAKRLENQGKNVSLRTVAIMLMGHRSLSLLVYEGGQLQSGKSSGIGPGFCKAVEAAAAIQSLPANDIRLVKALALNRAKVRIPGNLEPIDFSKSIAVGRQTY